MTRKEVYEQALDNVCYDDNDLFFDCLKDSLIQQGLDFEKWCNTKVDLSGCELCREEVYRFLED